jgi:hypothetical protein
MKGSASYAVSPIRRLWIALTEAVEIVRSLVDQVIFRPTADAGLEVELVGDIASIVHLAQNSNESIENGPDFRGCSPMCRAT